MPVHDAMYTHSVANKLQKNVDRDTWPELWVELETVKSMAHRASSDSAQAALAMFKVLDKAKISSNPYIRAEAENILASQYNVEIA